MATSSAEMVELRQRLPYLHHLRRQEPDAALCRQYVHHAWLLQRHLRRLHALAEITLSTRQGKVMENQNSLALSNFGMKKERLFPDT